MNLFFRIIIFLIFLLLLFLLISYFENRKLKTTFYTIHSNKLPAGFDGCKIALLTDLHNQILGDNNQLLIKAIENAHPDYVMMAGDMLTHQKIFDGTVVYQLLEQLSSRYEVFYSNGNHEQKLALNPDTKQSLDTFLQSMKALGVHHLANEHHFINRAGETICVHGLELDLRYYKKTSTKSIEPNVCTESIRNNSSNCFQILLAHNPIFFPEYASWGADLVLSGHVHGGMVVIPGIGGVLSTQCTLFPKYDFGKFKEGNATMILSRGLGGHTIRMRIFNRPELVIIELKKTLENSINN